MNEVEDTERGRKLLSAVERIIEDTEAIIAQVDRQRTMVLSTHPGIQGQTLRDKISTRLVRHYSNACAISGGATALPSLFPGAGSVIALTGGTLLDVAFILKFEVEMALALCWNHGFDIREERERELAFLLASVLVHDESTGESFVNDVARAEGEALWNYAPRQVPKILAQVLARIAMRQVGKGLFRMLPIVGIAVGAGLNKALTQKTGQRMVEELGRRRAEGEHERPPADVVDAATGAETPAQEVAPDDEIVEAAVEPQREVKQPIVADPPAAAEPPADPRAELEALAWDDLRARARAAGVPAKGKKGALIDAILAAEAAHD
ncbi:MAG: hypothetical protein ABIO70_07785 [Pseudomonadota bacterium]